MSNGKMTTMETGPDLPANPWGAEKTCSNCGYYTMPRQHPVKGEVGICRAKPPQTTALLVPVVRRQSARIMTAPDVEPGLEQGLELRVLSFWPDEILGGHWCGGWVPRPSGGAMQ